MQLSKEKTDSDIKSDVLTELKYEPSVKTTDIGVLVKDGAVTLTGFTTTYGEKWAAVRATKRVSGVRAVADDIKVKLAGSHERTDGEIAASAADHLEWSTSVPDDKVDITVQNGWVTLTGKLEWWYQKNAAENSVMFLTGVKGVTNLITIASKAVASEIAASIEKAFERNALLDSNKITVKTSGNDVTLTGKVRTYAEKEEAERVAWAAPGVYSVDDKIKVEWFWGITD
ncbi:MAG: BON domain-containing protein [Luteolibacter sp.]